jgi:hypothetical protein
MKILIFLLSFSLLLCQNIITSWNYDKVLMYDLQKINKFLLTQIAKKYYDFPEISYEGIKITNIYLDNIETNLYDSYINYNTSVFLFTPNKITLYFTFNYEEATKGNSGSATLELKIYTMKLKIRNDKTKLKPYVTAKMSSPIENYSIPGIADKVFLKSLQEAFFNGFESNEVLSYIIPSRINNYLTDYYTQFYSKKKSIMFTTSPFFEKKTFLITNNKFIFYCEDAAGDFKNGLCYYSCDSDKEEVKRDKTRDAISNERFIHNKDDLFNVFINNDLVFDITDEIAQTFYRKPKTYNNQTNVKPLSYKFDVASLKKYFSGLDGYFNDTDYFYCLVYIDYVTLTEARYRVRFDIVKRLNFFTLNITSKLDTEVPIIHNTKFNLCLKGIETTKVEVIYHSPLSKVEISDMDGLKKVIEESFDFNYNKICFTEDGISMKDYFAKIKYGYVRKEGLYLEGDHLYQ